jgi:voltage-gated potassium channel
LSKDAVRIARQIVSEARHQPLRELDADVLEQMRLDADKQRDRVADEVAEIGAQWEEARDAGQWARMQHLREHIMLLRDELDEVETALGRIEDAWQHRVLRDRMLERLGSQAMVSALEGLILVLIAAVLAILWIETAYDPTEAQQNMLTIIDTAICGVFLWEFFWRMRLAESNRWYWRAYWIDFVASLPLAGMLRIGRIARVARAARLARLARAARLLRAIRAIAFFSRGFDKIAAIFRLQVFSRPLALTIGLLVVGGIIISHTEGNAEGVENFWQGIWWSFTTVVTGGYGDIHNPVHTISRILTVLLVILGIVLTGALTAGLANILLGDETARIERRQMLIQEQLAALSRRLERIEADPAGDEAATGPEETTEHTVSSADMHDTDHRQE